ncbi:Protein CD4.5 [Aphelenchoides avenae]|nr:Protein CD4.5 [Aphelenchus avenae]
MVPQCEETKLDRNPLTFEIPQNLKPFRLRILAENIGRNDIILLDNVRYDGQICEVPSTTPSVLPLPLPTTTEETAVTLALPSLPSSPSTDLEQNVVTEEDATPSESAVLVTNDERLEATTTEAVIDPALDPCRVLVCDFNHGDACMFERSGTGATAEWRVGDAATGNPHTGIRRNHPSDGRLSGFAYVGLDGNDFSNEVFVMESHKFHLKQKAYLTFDLYHRSVGPELKVCINSFEDCPYGSPPLDVSQFWKTGQTLLLGEYAERVFFIVGKVRQNLYLAVDNIRLQNMDGSDYCSSRRK